MIKAVVFDLDNTVYNYDECHSVAMYRLQDYACNQYKIGKEEFEMCFNSARKEVKSLLGNTGAAHNRMLYMQIFLEKIKCNPVDGTLELYDVYWNTMLEQMKPFPYVISLMKWLKQNSILIGILTDLTAHIQHRKIKILGIESYIDAIVTSEEVGEEKPSLRAFNRIKEKLQCDENEILMLGDSKCKDIDGAVRAGMHAILFTLADTDVMREKVMEYINDQMDEK